MPSFPDASWSADHISTLWFESHFNHAANRVIEWIGAEQDFNDIKSMLDFGCGGGITTLGVALRYPHIQVQGVDIGDKFLQLPTLAKEQLQLQQLPDNLQLQKIPPLKHLAQDHAVDAIFSWSVFEHVPQSQIPEIFADLYQCLNPGGVFFLQIEPLYFSPWGSHLRRFVDTPWAHLRWTPEQLRQAVREYDGDIPPQHQGHQFHELDMETFKEFHLGEFDSLNHISADRIVRLLEMAGFEIVRETRLQVDIPVPDELLKKYNQQDLVTNGILLSAKK